MRMRMKMEGKVNDQGEPTPLFCVLTYSDLQSKNIMIQRTGSKENGSGSFAISLVDWETLGWYPEY